MKCPGKTIGFTAGGAICLAAIFFAGYNDSSNTTVETPPPALRAVTTSPDIPPQITFCGETVDLARYNRREGMDRELSSFAYYHSTTMLLLKRANRYFPVIEPILKAHHIPDDFKYLAVIESNLDPTAVSPARARGLWQFMESTAKEYRLAVTPTVDERYNIRRSTEAACKYLSEAYDKYGDWLLVALSYNAGMGRISSEYDRQHRPAATDMWLVEETSRYIYRIFAVKLIFENPYKYGFAMNARNLYKSIPCDEVTVSEDIPDLADFAAGYQLTLSDLKRFNPWLKDTRLNVEKNTYVILIPRIEHLRYDNPDETTVHDPRWVEQN
ncbi:MAG: lytic transglycosylase domain-containing protein [Tannerella sp.]|jgi:hypothetical protein|nr:lytic transglycosylase domain-containing protein [Tannerella sp.]